MTLKFSIQIQCPKVKNNVFVFIRRINSQGFHSPEGTKFLDFSRQGLNLIVSLRLSNAWFPLDRNVIVESYDSSFFFDLLPKDL